ncbi:xanthine dehydrogenase family protein subunit M [Aeromicrobium phragmitis]|uniref:Xanthine dehydrogenase family protein subunit M n=1 Tax=Aeromicrobium phragmitis TaxID=2478914 RepID=A0A3L8PQ94_9ACTN|nr:xanthine dehydrogenase family protein subunit M [Aeromicrobium phragmitis]RLV57364.1 xanthine dehydrogenase family protein subunit M [Aeromicrobium phragmitis]
MKAPPISYAAAESVEEAVALLTEHGDDAKVLAGGQSLLPMLNLRLAQPGVLVDIGRIEELRHSGVTEEGGRLCGSLTTHRELEMGAVPSLGDVAVLRTAASHIGHLPIRTQGTIGGSIAHADSASEWCVLALALDAVIHVRGTGGARRMPAESFFHGFFSTALEPDEIITGIEFPVTGSSSANFEEYARRSGDFAIVASAVALDLREGRCESARIALGGVAGAPIRLPEVERLAEGHRFAGPDDEAVRELAHACAEAIDPPSDVHASSTYRKRLTEVLVSRAVAGCLRHDDSEGGRR